MKLQKQESSEPLRRSPRLRALRQLNNGTAQSGKQETNRDIQSLWLKSSTGCIAKPSTPDVKLSSQTRGQKRAREDRSSPSRKRRRISVPQPARPDSSRDDEYTSPIDYWRKSGYLWPRGDWLKNSMDTNPTVGHLLVRKKSTSSLRRKRSDNEFPTESSTTRSDQYSRETKSAQYRDPRYSVLLSTKNSFMDKDDVGIVEKSKALIRKLLNTEQPVPTESLFRDDIFETTCRKLRDRNEARVVRDVSLLMVPSAEILTTYGEKELACLTESVNEGWTNCVPLTKTGPQPDYAVGFRREAFTEEQLKKLEPFVGELTDQSFFMATYYLYFPFLSCEVKCGAAALDVADRQNAHSMTLALRAVIELFRLVKREKELDREILAFSISHDHRSVRMYGHYAVIEDEKTAFYRYPIREFCFTELEGKEKWTSNMFTTNVYRTWMPAHFKRLCSAIDALPANVNFEVSQQSELQFCDHTSLSQDLASHGLAASVSESTSLAQDVDSQLQPLDTPDTSFTKDSARGGRTKQGRY